MLTSSQSQQTIQFFGIKSTVLAPGGDHSLIEQVIPRDGSPPPILHTHAQTETIFVTSGRLAVYGRDEAGKKYEITLDSGMSVFIPSRTPHGFEALVDSTVLIVLTPPGNLEALFIDLSKIETPNEEQIMPLFKKHGFELLEPMFPAAK